MSSEGWKFGKIDYFLQAVAATCGNNAFSATLKKDRDIEVQVQEEKIFREDFLRKSVTMAEKSSAIIHSDIGRSVYASAKKILLIHKNWTPQIEKYQVGLICAQNFLLPRKIQNDVFSSALNNLNF